MTEPVPRQRRTTLICGGLRTGMGGSGIARATSAMLALACLGAASGVEACSSPSDRTVHSVVISPVAVENPPDGAVQLRVVTPDPPREAFDRMTFEILEVVDGVFDADTVLVNLSNVDHCSSYLFDPFEQGQFITVLPLQYSDGEAVRDDNGVAEYGAVFYEDKDFASLSNKPRTQSALYAKFERHTFYDSQKLECISNGGGTAEAWRQCVEPGQYVGLDCKSDRAGALICAEADWPADPRPDDLRRGYQSKNEEGVSARTLYAVLAAVLGMLLVLGLKLKVARDR